MCILLDTQIASLVNCLSENSKENISVDVQRNSAGKDDIKQWAPRVNWTSLQVEEKNLKGRISFTYCCLLRSDDCWSYDHGKKTDIAMFLVMQLQKTREAQKDDITIKIFYR